MTDARLTPIAVDAAQRVEAVVAAAEQQAEEILVLAEQHAHAMVVDARQRAAALTAEAEREAAATRDAAERDATATRERALGEVHAELTRLRSTARELSSASEAIGAQVRDFDALMGESASGAATAPEVESVPIPDPPAQPSPPAPLARRAAVPTPQSDDLLDAARLVALSMAAGGSTPEDVERHLRRHLEIEDPASIIGFVFSTPSSIVARRSRPLRPSARGPR
jgi:F0F1-type ATP synthase membrane subunit b/b'